MASVSPASLGPSEPAGVLGLNLRPLGPPPAVWVLGSWDGGREEEKWRQDGTGTPEGWLEEGKGSHARRGPLTVRGSAGTGRDLQDIGGSEGNPARVSPAHSGPCEPARVPCLNLCPPGLPPAVQILSLNPAPHGRAFSSLRVLSPSPATPCPLQRPFPDTRVLGPGDPTPPRPLPATRVPT